MNDPIRWNVTGLLLALLAACALPSPNPVPTPLPQEYIPTAIALTMNANAAASPSGLSEPPVGPVTEMPTLTPTLAPPASTESPPPDFLFTPTFTATPFPQPPEAAIQILAPGPMSKVVSPIKLRAYVIPGHKKLVRVELFGEDGRLLARQILRLDTTRKWAYLSVEIPFEIRAVAEMARLQISTEDQHGRTSALVGVHILLQSQGLNAINPPGKLEERCILNYPLPENQISGGTLIVEGKMRPFNDQPLVIELISATGQVLGSRMVAMQPAPDDSYVPFIIDVPYQVTEPTWVRLTLRQSDNRIAGPMYLYSQEVLLNP